MQIQWRRRNILVGRAYLEHIQTLISVIEQVMIDNDSSHRNFQDYVMEVLDILHQNGISDKNDENDQATRAISLRPMTPGFVKGPNCSKIPQLGASDDYLFSK